jgi:hypothetical protein
MQLGLICIHQPEAINLRHLYKSTAFFQRTVLLQVETSKADAQSSEQTVDDLLHESEQVVDNDLQAEQESRE